MTFRIVRDASYFFPVPHIYVFRVIGKDAPRYLHSRLTNAIRTLPVGYSCQAAALTPQGKTEGLFTCLRTDESEYFLSCDGGDSGEILAALRRYIVADQVTIEPTDQIGSVIHVSATVKAHICSAALIDPLLVPELIPENALRIAAIIPNHRLEEPGFDMWSWQHWEAAEPLRETLSQFQCLTPEEFEILRLSGGFPSFPSELNPSRLLTEAPIGRLVAKNKGCYVGQEVIERVESRGATPRLLARFSCESIENLTPGAVISVNRIDGTYEKIGEVLSSVSAGEGVLGFASIRRQAEPAVPILLEGRKGKFNWVSEH
jgi:folate-binding protein YgfZ